VFHFLEGRASKRGNYDNGLLSGAWRYDSDGHSFTIDWVSLRDSSSGLFLSIPSTFRIDTTQQPGHLRFVRIDSVCSDILALQITPMDSSQTFSSLIEKEMRFSDPNFSRSGEECNIVELDSGSSPLLDIKAHVVTRMGEQKETRFTQRRMGDMSCSFVFIHCGDDEYQNLLYGDILQSCIFRSEYFYDPRSSIKNISTCP